jgi:hypothetical protein
MTERSEDGIRESGSMQASASIGGMAELVAALADLELTIATLGDATLDETFSREEIQRALLELGAIVKDLHAWSANEFIAKL